MGADARDTGAGLVRSWTLIGSRGPSGPVPTLPDHAITLEIDGDRWAGSAGCNRYTTTVARDGDRVAVPGGIATTLMACGDDVMAAEIAYLALLPAVEALDLGPDRLTLRGPDVELRFEPTVADARTPLGALRVRGGDGDDRTAGDDPDGLR